MPRQATDNARGKLPTGKLIKFYQASGLQSFKIHEKYDPILPDHDLDLVQKKFRSFLPDGAVEKWLPYLLGSIMFTCPYYSLPGL